MISLQRRRRMDSPTAVRWATAMLPSPPSENSCWIRADSLAYRSRNSLLAMATVFISATIPPSCAKLPAEEGGRSPLFPKPCCRRTRLERAVAAFLVAYPDGIVDSREENFPVSDLPGARRSSNRPHNLFHHLVGQHDLEFYLGNQVHRVFASPVELGVSFLPAMAPGFKHGHAFYANFMQGVFHHIQL